MKQKDKRKKRWRSAMKRDGWDLVPDSPRLRNALFWARFGHLGALSLLVGRYPGRSADVRNGRYGLVAIRIVP